MSVGWIIYDALHLRAVDRLVQLPWSDHVIRLRERKAGKDDMRGLELVVVVVMVDIKVK